MNLLEINAEKLISILRTSPDHGLTDKQVQLNRREFADLIKYKGHGIQNVFRTVFGDAMLVLFVLLSIFSLDVHGNRSAGVGLILLTLFYFAFQIVSSVYTKRVEERIKPFRRSVCTVRRGGGEQEIEYSELVPGDILVLKKGDVVPCDALVLSQKTLRVLEVQLTGNTSPVVKLTQEDVLSGKGCPYYECILFAGSIVSSGEAIALVCNIGETIFDKKNKLVLRVKHDNRPLIYEKAATIARDISLVWIIICTVTVIVGILKGEELFSLFYLATTLSVATLPDLILTLSDLNIAISTDRLLKKGCAVKNYSAIDRMCDINCVAVDSSRYFRTSSPKPHTVIVGGEKKRFKNGEDSDVMELFELAVVACAGKSGDGGMYYNGVSVEKSLLSSAERLGVGQKKLYEKYLLLERLPFNRENGMSRVIVYRDGKFYLVCLGIPEYILRASSAQRVYGIDKNFFEKDKRRLLEDSRLIAADNEGMVAVSIKEISYKEGTGQIDNPRGSTFMGFIGLHTAIMADAARAVNVCDKSGIDILLMTNEPRHTSVGFADSLAIMKSGEAAIDSLEFEKIDEGLFRADIKKYKVFLSLDSTQKEKVVRFRKSDGDIVAATASNVDDIPLQLEADVSFCVDTVRDDALIRNSDAVLLKGFDLVPECIKYARCIYRNIRHMLEFLMMSQFTLASCAFMFLIFLPKIAFTPAQIIIWSVLVCLPVTFLLSTERVRGTELRATFGEENVNINFQNLIGLPLVTGLGTGLVIALCARLGVLFSESVYACRGASFITAVVSGVMLAFSITGDYNLSKRLFTNKSLILFSFPILLIALMFVYVPSLARSVAMSLPGTKLCVIAVLLGFIPSLLSFAVKLLKKYVFNNFKQ